MAERPKPFMWTLRATVEARQTTWHCCLWFSDPQNSGWEPLFTADQLEAYAAAKVAEERERIATLIRTHSGQDGDCAVGPEPRRWMTGPRATGFDDEDPRCTDGGHACMDCMCRGACLKAPNTQMTGAIRGTEAHNHQMTGASPVDPQLGGTEAASRGE